MADRVPTREEITQLLESGTTTVQDLGPQTRAVYDAMVEEQGRPETTALSVLADPYQAISNVTASPLVTFLKEILITRQALVKTSQTLMEELAYLNL